MTQADCRYLQNESNITIYGIGSLFNDDSSAPAKNSPFDFADIYNRYQSRTRTTRLGIPLVYGSDAMHGYNNVKGAIIFHHNISLSRVWNIEFGARSQLHNA